MNHTFDPDPYADPYADPYEDRYADRIYTLEFLAQNPMKIDGLRPITGICGTLRMYPIVNQATYDELFKIESRMYGPKPKQ